MIYSPLTDYIKVSPNYNTRNGIPISKITIHHTAGLATVEGLGELFADPSREGSANYGIGFDGSIGVYVSEEHRAWTSSSYVNDVQAVTIEVSNDIYGGNWHVSDHVLSRLIDLCVDICKRNNIERLNFTGDETGNLTMHKYFAPTVCPGEYLESKFPYIADEVNKRLNEGKPMTDAERKEFEALTEKVRKLETEVNEVKIKYDWTTACPEWARGAVHKLHQRGIIKGDENGRLRLTDPMVRILVILDRIGLLG